MAKEQKIEDEKINETDIDNTDSENNEIETEKDEETIIQELKELVQKKEEEAEENNKRYLRALAELENFKKRKIREQIESRKMALKDFILGLLEIVDNFERAKNSVPENAKVDDVLQGFDLIYKQLFNYLKQNGLEKINAVGEPFNPKFHHAIKTDTIEDENDDIVIEELQCGYKLQDIVIRPSSVIVNKK